MCMKCVHIRFDTARSRTHTHMRSFRSFFRRVFFALNAARRRPIHSHQFEFRALSMFSPIRVRPPWLEADITKFMHFLNMSANAVRLRAVAPRWRSAPIEIHATKWSLNKFACDLFAFGRLFIAGALGGRADAMRRIWIEFSSVRERRDSKCIFAHSGDSYGKGFPLMVRIFQ